MPIRTRRKNQSDPYHFWVVCKGYDKTCIQIYCTTKLQQKHIIEMFGEIKEKGRIKYTITSGKI